MIHVTTPALTSTLVHLGLSEAFIRRAAGTIGLLKLDPVACSFHRELEDQLLQLIEDCGLHEMALLDIDDLIRSANVLTATLNRLVEHYRFRGIFDRADRVFDLSRGITQSLAWA